MKRISFKPEKVTEKILSDLPERSQDILKRRYALLDGKRKETLESIGKRYGITRERVRQIEELTKKTIKEAEYFVNQAQKAVDSLKEVISSYGGVVGEDILLKDISKSQDSRDHVYFLLDLADPFSDFKKEDHLEKLWFTDKNNFEKVEKSLNDLYKDIKTDELLTEEQIVDKFLLKLQKNKAGNDIIKAGDLMNLVKLSKKVGKNGMDQWGRTDSRNISTRGAADYAYLIFREKGEPIHFSEIADKISKKFGKKCNTATCHNELIKDDRFILVGRGKYGLKEWGKYDGDTVSKIIEKFLKKKKKAMSKDEIMEEVLSKKDIKSQTVVINLNNKDKFKRNKEGKYILA